MEIKSVTESVVLHLRNRIIMGDLEAGQWLNENQLSSEIGVSRPPLREAFRVLEHERLVENTPRKGTRVTYLSIEDLEQVCQARETIECRAVDLLATQKNVDLEPLFKATAQESVVPAPSLDDANQRLIYLEAFADFHVKLVELAGNYWLSHFQRAFSSNLARYQFLYLFITGAPERSLLDHEKTLEYLKRGAFNEARDNLREHIRFIAELLKKSLLEDDHARQVAEDRASAVESGRSARMVMR